MMDAVDEERGGPTGLEPAGGERPWTSWALDLLGVTAFVVLFVACGRSLASALGSVDVALGAATVVTSVVVAWLAADALSGAVHYWADNHGSPRWPILGDALIRPFREHHEHPERMLAHGPIERSGGPALLASSALWLSLGVEGPALFEIGVLGFSLGLGGFTAVTNEIHALAHRACVPGWVHFLQRRGILLSREAHALHHQGNHDTHYCITSGAVDRILGALRRGRGDGHLA